MSVDLIKKDFIESNELFAFIKNAFKEGLVPVDKEEFMACFSTETTDDSLCFARQFGEGVDDAVMLFFHPLKCLVPPRYQKHLRYDEPFGMRLLTLDYQKLLASKTGNPDYLSQLCEEIEECFCLNQSSLKEIICQRIRNSQYVGDGKSAEQIVKEVAMSFAKYEQKYFEVKSFVDSKIMKYFGEKDVCKVAQTINIDRRLK